MTWDPALEAHREWLGLLSPVGLLVAPPALIRAQAVLKRNVADEQAVLASLVVRDEQGRPRLTDFPRFAVTVLGWALSDLAGARGGPRVPEGLELVLPDEEDTLRPTYVAVDGMGDGRPLLLVRLVSDDFDEKTGEHWHASPHHKLERLLREVGRATTDTPARCPPVGVLVNERALRLVYAPPGESSGYATFQLDELLEVSGRPLLAALLLLLGEARVFTERPGRRLVDLLTESRKYQALVSTELADQVLDALWELLRGFQAADEAAAGRVMSALSREDPEHVYGGLLTVLMRLVFVLYAEAQGLLPSDAVYARGYSLAGIYERLREDAGQNPDTMDQRHGAWAALLSLFRFLFDGGEHVSHEGALRLPTRHGQLMDPNEYPFLEGRSRAGGRQRDEALEVPRVSDGCVYRVLDLLLVLDGERLSYRALDVEQIGSVYEAMMGFEVERTTARSIAVRPKDIVVSVDAVLEQEPSKRARWLQDQAECKLTGKSAEALSRATTPDEAVAALDRRVSRRTPRWLPAGALVLQPGEERRRSGSHYTPRELTAPIVEHALGPVLEDLGERPTAEAILEMKVCDPAMGSGAFLVEACRQLGARLEDAWRAHGSMPAIPIDEEPRLHAQRLVAQRCLYGVDKNPFAVNLAKLSLWLITMAKDHPFTFLDHALKCGDSLVGLTLEEIGAFHWNPPKRDYGPLFAGVKRSVDDARIERAQILAMTDDQESEKRLALRDADEGLDATRRVGDAIVAAFFEGSTARERETRRVALRDLAETLPGHEAIEAAVAGLRGSNKPVRPFHWAVEFPEVFQRDNGGFDVMVGNPPFAGKNTTISAHREGYTDWLKMAHPESHGNADLVAHFFRRTFTLVRDGGTFGLIATNTIAQGDTRSTGLRFIRKSGGTIYRAVRRLRWPGMAAVVVSVVHIRKLGTWKTTLDGQPVPEITAFLTRSGGDEDPARLHANHGSAFVGNVVLGIGFTFDDDDRTGKANTIAEMNRLVLNPNNRKRILPYVNGQELNSWPRPVPKRFVINFEMLSEDDARAGWPELLEIVEQKVKPDRLKQSSIVSPKYWWRFARSAGDLYEAVAGLDRVMARALTSANFSSFTFLPTGLVYDQTLIVFPFRSAAALALLCSRVHETWALFLGGTMKDDARYNVEDCFETFPFPAEWRNHAALESAGETYYTFRAQLMADATFRAEHMGGAEPEGLTKTYNRFHDPDERLPGILRLRELHVAMDRAVLDAYGWTDVATDCDFLLDFEIDEEEWGTKKKPYRYRWPDAIRDEVLARLLQLNQERAEAERLAGTVAQPESKSAKPKRALRGKKQTRQTDAAPPSLFPSKERGSS